MEKKSTDRLCLAPWLSAHTWPNGDVFPCCVWDPNDSVGNINDQPLELIWNNDRMKKTRLDMLNGSKVKSCERCYKLEEFSPESYRLKIKKDFKHLTSIVDQTNEDGSLNDMKIRLWDFRLSNFCQLRCRSCGTTLSSSWHSDMVAMYPTLKDSTKALITVNDKVSFMDMIDDQYQYVEEVYFAGGEPLITPEHYTILSKLIKIGNTNVRLRYSTNFMNLEYKGKHIFEYWKHFPNLEVLVSLDGVKEKGEYIRKGMDYSKLKANILLLKESKLSFTKIGFIVTYGVLNYEHLFDLVLEFFQSDMIDKKFPEHGRYNIREVIFSPIFEPSYLDCSFLPDSFKIRFLNRLQNFKKELLKIDVDEIIILNIINGLKVVYEHSKRNSYNSVHMNKFITETTKVDKVRKESFTDIFPEYDLKDFINEQ